MSDERPIDWAGWFLRECVGAALVYIGFGKFDETPNGQWIRIFERIGFGRWFRHATGVVEIAGGVLLVLPRTKIVGAVLLSAAMIAVRGRGKTHKNRQNDRACPVSHEE